MYTTVNRIDEDVFIEPVPDIGMMRLNSVDSGNGNGPSTSTGSGDSDDITCISSLPGPGLKQLFASDVDS